MFHSRRLGFEYAQQCFNQQQDVLAVAHVHVEHGCDDSAGGKGLRVAVEHADVVGVGSAHTDEERLIGIDAMEGLGIRRTLGEPATVQSGEFRANLLEGPGVESVGDQRYAGGFRGGKRSGYGQVTSADGKVQSGRWEDGKRVETTP